MNGPILAAYNVADDLGWAHFGCLQKLLMILNGVKSLWGQGLHDVHARFLWVQG
jgi:hypothetical protein